MTPCRSSDNISPPRLLATVSALTLIALMIAPGCSTRRDFEPSQDPAAMDGTAFLHYLATVPFASVDEGCRGILLVVDGAERFPTPEERQAELQHRGFIREAWGLHPDDVLDLGTLAFLTFKACDLPGGVNTTLFGSWGLGDRRYALKEVAAEGLLTYDSAHAPVRGGELLNALTKIDERLSEPDGQ